MTIQPRKSKLESVESIVKRDKCPMCRGELDTGWECNDCGFDAQVIATGTKQ